MEEKMKKLFIDLGGHHGESLKHFSKILECPNNWDAISIEASPLNYKELQKKANQIKNVFNNIETINAFAYINDSEIDFYEYIDPPHHVGSTFSKYKVEFNSKKKPAYRNLRYNLIKVPSYNIIDVYKRSLNAYDKILIKMDVEGAEYDIFPELVKILDPDKTPVIYCEFHNKKVNISRDVDKKIIKDLKRKDVRLLMWK
jgi:FkbM family methyltransferase